MEEGIKAFFTTVAAGLEIWFVVYVIKSIKEIKNEYLHNITKLLNSLHHRLDTIKIKDAEIKDLKKQIKDTEIEDLKNKITKLEHELEKQKENTPE